MLTTADYAAIELERFATLEEAGLHADDLNNNDLDGYAEAIVIKHDDGYCIFIVYDRYSASR